MRFVFEQGKWLPEALAKEKHKDRRPISRLPDLPSCEKNPEFPFSPTLLAFLEGKQLLIDDIPFSLEQIQAHYENGYLRYQKGITQTERGGYRCERCGNERAHLFASFHCARCEESCTYCRQCLMMGRVSECTPLVVSCVSPKRIAYDRPLVWSGKLSHAQQAAAEAVKQAIDRHDELTVWAVCGAGKTEVLFPGIAHALERGRRVCIATPRMDVVLELAPRFKQAFPTVPIIALYGGSEDRFKQAPLVMATTHQLLRFYRAFDVMIIDEVDAFPYSVEPMLQYAAAKARCEPSALIYLTATPHPAWQREIQKNKRMAATIPARYHGYPLPVPAFEWCGHWRKQVQKGKLPRNVLAWANERIQGGRPALLFVPHIALLQQVVQILKRLDARIAGVHAEDSARKEKVHAFRQGAIPLLVTTTILERGVTIPRLDVAVLGAEDDLFTEGALVQIAGRVGRSAQHPNGDVRFFHYGKTKAMIAAKRQIVRMNRLAQERGLLKSP